MITGILIYLIVGFILVAQHFYRFYITNKFMYKNKTELAIESKWFYLGMGLLWPFGLDFLFSVDDYRKEINDEIAKDT
jgi:hypothetical protein